MKLSQLLKSICLIVWGALMHAPALSQSDQSCADLPRIEAVTAKGWCVGVVADSKDGLRMPRHVVWLGQRNQNNSYLIDLLVVDMGSWEAGKGRLLHLTWSAATKKSSIKEIFSGLDRPHGLEKGPDGAFYLGEASKISRFTWKDNQASVLETVLSNLPIEGRHPLKALVFGADGHLYFNVGAATDRCQGAGSKLLPLKKGLPHCTEMEGAQPQAAVYVAKMQWPQAKLIRVEPYATGLRNSMGLAAHPSGTLLQAENNIDFPDEKFPPEEINVLLAGKHYGWPSCVGNRLPIPGAITADCKLTQAPALLMPAHAAPLHLAYTQKSFAAEKAKEGNRSTGLLVSWHGYRSAGQKIVRYDTNDRGIPQGPAQELISQWKVPAKQNTTHAGGAPVAWAQDQQGHLWIADDRNKMLVWFGRQNSQP